MSGISERYARLAGDFAATVRAVPGEKWGSAAPCEGWSALDVVRHVVGSEVEFFDRVTGREVGPIPKLDEEPLAAWQAVSAAVQADLDDPVRAAKEYDGYFGRTTFEETIDGFYSFDLVIHRWDLARAAGLEVQLDPEEVRRVHEQAAALGDNLRGAGVCGPELTPPEGADDQTKLLAFLGRRAW